MTLIDLLYPGRSHPELESLDTDLTHAATYKAELTTSPLTSSSRFEWQQTRRITRRIN